MSDLDPQDLRLLEALLFAAEEPLSETQLAPRLPEGADLPALLARLSEDYQDRGVSLVQSGGSWAFRTAPDMAERLSMDIESQRKLSRAALETLAIIAYHQPITRSEIEEVRGVSLSKGTLDVLVEAGWVRPFGRRQTPGRPLTWGTTDAFLDHFSLPQISDLPGLEDLKAAGLLDARPAASSYAENGEEGVSPETEDADLDPEPLDPEG